MQWIDEPEALEDLWAHLREQRVIALDLEADNFHAYQAHICLIQLATPTREVLIDPLALTPEALAPLGAVLNDRGIEKILHGADNDILGLDRDYGFRMRNLFDTLEAARFLNIERPGLSTLLDARFGVRQSKRYQRLNWRRRPLPDGALEYACQDVRYLLALRDQLVDELEARRLLEAVHQSCGALARRRYEHRPFDPEGWREIKAARRLSGEQLAVLRALYLWRHAQCEQENRAHLFILTNGAMVALAAQRPQSVEALREVRALSAALRERHGQALLEVIDAARKEPAPGKQRRRRRRGRRLDDAARARLDALRDWRQKRSAADTLAPELIATNRVLEALAARAPSTRADLGRVEGVLPWQVARYGDELLALLASIP